jgi:hypothetical protein
LVDVRSCVDQIEGDFMGPVIADIMVLTKALVNNLKTPALRIIWGKATRERLRESMRAITKHVEITL